MCRIDSFCGPARAHAFPRPRRPLLPTAGAGRSLPRRRRRTALLGLGRHPVEGGLAADEASSPRHERPPRPRRRCPRVWPRGQMARAADRSPLQCRSHSLAERTLGWPDCRLAPPSALRKQSPPSRKSVETSCCPWSGVRLILRQQAERIAQFYASRAHATSVSQGRFEPCSGLAHGADEDDLLVPHKELSTRLHERNPLGRVSTLPF